MQTHLVVSGNDLVADLQLALLQSTNVQDITVVHLHVLDLELGLTIDGKDTSVVLLSTLLGVEVGLVQEDAKWSVGGNVLGRLVEVGRVVDSLDVGFDVIEGWGSALDQYCGDVRYSPYLNESSVLGTASLASRAARS
jgi:hypothetical protein